MLPRPSSISSVISTFLLPFLSIVVVSVLVTRWPLLKRLKKSWAYIIWVVFFTLLVVAAPIPPVDDEEELEILKLEFPPNPPKSRSKSLSKCLLNPLSNPPPKPPNLLKILFWENISSSSSNPKSSSWKNVLKASNGSKFLPKWENSKPLPAAPYFLKSPYSFFFALSDKTA